MVALVSVVRLAGRESPGTIEWLLLGVFVGSFGYRLIKALRHPSPAHRMGRRAFESIMLTACAVVWLSGLATAQLSRIQHRLIAVSVRQRYGPSLRVERWHSGYIDSTGKTIIPLRFDDARGFSDGLAAVQVGGQWGYIDTLGTFVIQPQFEYGADFSEGVAWVQSVRDGWRWYIDRTGRAAFATKFDLGDAGDFSYGRASVRLRGARGYIDHTGTMVIREQSYSYHPEFSDGLAAMQVGEQWGFIDTTGTMVIRPQFPVDNHPFGP